MKPAIMLLTLSLYSTALLAQQAENKSSNTGTKHSYLNDVSSTQLKPAQTFNTGPHFRKLIQPVKKETDVKLIKAELETQAALKG